jgi:hypothetical protein
MISDVIGAANIGVGWRNATWLLARYLYCQMGAAHMDFDS